MCDCVVLGMLTVCCQVSQPPAELTLTWRCRIFLYRQRHTKPHSVNGKFNIWLKLSWLSLTAKPNVSFVTLREVVLFYSVYIIFTKRRLNTVKSQLFTFDHAVRCRPPSPQRRVGRVVQRKLRIDNKRLTWCGTPNVVTLNKPQRPVMSCYNSTV